MKTKQGVKEMISKIKKKKGELTWTNESGETDSPKQHFIVPIQWTLWENKKILKDKEQMKNKEMSKQER